MGIRAGIDTGGTFTDLVALDEDTGEFRLAKALSTPRHPRQATTIELPLPSNVRFPSPETVGPPRYAGLDEQFPSSDPDARRS